ncbi:MAG: hypothetical protein AAAC47_15515 [Pararhizobium sp.]
MRAAARHLTAGHFEKERREQSDEMLIEFVRMFEWNCSRLEMKV